MFAYIAKALNLVYIYGNIIDVKNTFRSLIKILFPSVIVISLPSILDVNVNNIIVLLFMSFLLIAVSILIAWFMGFFSQSEKEFILNIVRN